jgi:hypothetical protein
MVMQGPFKLSNKVINEKVTKNSPGAYQLSNSRGSVKYVGRSDENLNSGLKLWIKKYAYFWFSYAISQLDTFEQECNSYHSHGGPQGHLDNGKHPQRPAGTTWRCPKCNIFGKQENFTSYKIQNKLGFKCKVFSK